MDPYPDCPDHSADEMVYTKARLEHALRVFREASSYLRNKGLPSENLERHLRSKYAFRKSSKIVPFTNVTLWQAKDDAGSDDEEYDPGKEKKKLNTKKKRKSERKRKAEDCGDQDQHIKRSKGEESTFGDDGAYISFKLTSQKGKQLLEDLSRVHWTDLGNCEEERSEEVEPSYWKRYSSSYAGARRRSAFDILLDDGSTDVNVDVDDESDMKSQVLATSLRNGKVREKLKDTKKQNRRTNSTSKHAENVITESRAELCHSNAIQKRCRGQNHNNRSFKQIDSVIEPSELRHEKDEEIEQSANVIHPTGRKHRDNVTHNTKMTPELSPPSMSLSDDFSFTRTQSLLDQPGLITIETAYAHPIDFRYMPPVGQRCDFCSDWRMGILGHGSKIIQVFIDPEHPTQFQEMGNGHRSFGKTCTKMCISCALDRLLIVRCHCPDQDQNNGHGELYEPESKRTTPVFSKIPGLVSTGQNLNLYQTRLLPTKGTPQANTPPSKTGPLPACSLCPLPAAWQCDKWQKADKMKKPCRIPNDTPSAASAVCSLSSTSPIPYTALTNGHKRKVSIITLSDSDDDLSIPFSKRSTTTTATSISQTPSFRRAPSTLSSTSSQQPLRPPLRGCGLKLCSQCKSVVEEQCGGQLDKKKIMKWLREESRGKMGRADVEWLFEGSMLERTYERGVWR